MLERVDAQLDEALARLSPADRTAVTLRYLQSRPLREVAEMMGTTEQAASKRVTRAVAKLRKIFARRGIDLTPAALVGALEQAAQVEVPPGLADGAFAAATGATTGAATAAIAIARDALGRASLRAALIAATLMVVVAGALVTAGVLTMRPAARTVSTVPPAATS